jgi:hypothetical protein
MLNNILVQGEFVKKLLNFKKKENNRSYKKPAGLSAMKGRLVNLDSICEDVCWYFRLNQDCL